METIDINKVAGLQALDSEGNVLGVVSMEQLTDMVAGKLATELAAQNTVPAMRTMSMTASPAAASVAATGVDKTEGQLGDVTDPGYVRVLDKSGNSGKQGIEQFAQVVGELNEINKMVQFTDEQVSDCNDCKPQRIYLLSNKTNKPNFMTTHLLVCIGGDYLKCQIATDDTNVVGFRAFYNNKWTEWRAI